MGTVADYGAREVEAAKRVLIELMQILGDHRDGDFNSLALIDAASCFLLCFVPLPLKQAEPTRSEARQFLETAYVHKHRWPNKLIIDSGRLFWPPKRNSAGSKSFASRRTNFGRSSAKRNPPSGCSSAAEETGGEESCSDNIAVTFDPLIPILIYSTLRALSLPGGKDVF